MRFKPVLIAIAFIAAVAFLVWCNREPKPKPVADKPEAALQSKIDTHAIRSAIEKEYQQRETNLIAAYSDSLVKNKVIVRVYRDKAVASVNTYQNSPSLAKCDTAIADLQSHVSKLETSVSISDSIITGQNRLNASLNGTVLRQEEVISDVNEIAKTALVENAGLKKKVARKNTLLKISGAVITALLAGLALK